jgi:hypothetical protein
MQAHADALPRLVRVAEPGWRQPATPSVQDRDIDRDVREIDKPEIGPDADLPYDPRALVMVAGCWLAFYVVAVIHGS